MYNVLVYPKRKALRQQEHQKRSKSFLTKLSKSASLILIGSMFVVGAIVGLLTNVSIKSVMNDFQYDVLIILVIMELFTNLIAQTGIMQLLAVKISEFSQGRKRLCLVLFAAVMFLISSCLNNITAVMMILPIVFVLLKTLQVDRNYICVFFATILALSNTGGAASPIGDFPAIVIMTSGITDFISYLIHAFPLFAFTSAALIAVWSMSVKREKDDGALRTLAISNLKSQYKNIEIRFDVLRWLIGIFVCMFVAWSFVPQHVIPPEIIAVIGYVVAMVICSIKKVEVVQSIDMKSVLTIASFLFFAQVISHTGLLNLLAAYLQNSIDNPKLLVMAIMCVTSLVAGVFSAGPAAAAMMPVIVEVCNSSLGAQSDWIAVAYAAAICAGSSLFLWSATAGFILQGKITATNLTGADGHMVKWGVGEYLKYGFVNYIIQLSIALAVIYLVL